MRDQKSYKFKLYMSIATWLCSISILACVLWFYQAHKDTQNIHVNVVTDTSVLDTKIIDSSLDVFEVASEVVDISVTDVQPEVEEVKEEVRVKRSILITGDSEACAVANYTRFTVAALDNVNVACVGGTTIQYWISNNRFVSAVTKYKPDIVIIFLGTNHYLQNSNVTSPEPLLREIVSKQIKCIWVGNTAVYNKKWPINKIIKSYVESTCTYFDTENANIQLSDGVHPTSAGAKKWLTQIWSLLP